MGKCVNRLAFQLAGGMTLKFTRRRVPTAKPIAHYTTFTATRAEQVDRTKLKAFRVIHRRLGLCVWFEFHVRNFSAVGRAPGRAQVNLIQQSYSTHAQRTHSTTAYLPFKTTHCTTRRRLRQIDHKNRPPTVDRRNLHACEPGEIASACMHVRPYHA